MQPVTSHRDTVAPGPARPAPRPTPAEAGWPDAALARVAELEQQVEQFKASVGLKDEFISMVSHELRSPLTAIKGSARTLLRHGERLDSETVDQLLTNVDLETDRLVRLLDNLLDLARAEAGANRQLIQPTPLRPLLARILAELRPHIGGRRTNLRVARRLPPAQVDPLRFEQVVRNLLDNALSYSPPAATVLVSAAAREALVEVSVRNDGPRLPPDVLPRLFERFYRGEASSQRGGAGLGLTICRRLVEAQGGTIWAESDSGGVVFRFTLPAATEALG